MFGWIPRWHPFVWLLFIVAVVAVWSDPAGWGERVGHLLGYIPLFAHRVTIFVTSI